MMPGSGGRSLTAVKLARLTAATLPSGKPGTGDIGIAFR